MNKHQIRYLGLLVLLLPGSVAAAADLGAPGASTPAPGFSWTGFYLGGNVGGGFGTSRKDFIQGTTTSDFNTSGVIGGLTAGYNHQFGSVVAGLEGDISASGIKGIPIAQIKYSHAGPRIIGSQRSAGELDMHSIISCHT
jgi:opacity protein-like surface antigen